jgi:hypothetical protein
MSAATCCTASSSRALQATIDLLLYIVFFLPGIVAWSWAGWSYASESWRSANIPRSRPTGRRSIPFKFVIPLAGGAAAAAGHRRNHPLRRLPRTGAWPARDQDVEEVDVEKLKEMVHAQGRGHRRARPYVVARYRPQGGRNHEQGTLVRLHPDGADHRRPRIILPAASRR